MAEEPAEPAPEAAPAPAPAPEAEEEPAPAPEEESAPIEEVEPDDGTSHISNPAGVFEPVPYAFLLKDLYGNQLYLPSNEISNAKISCPPFYTLLDHVIAVLWIVYSGQRSYVLRSSHVHWTLKFLEGMKDRHNRYSPDVEMAIGQLGELLIDICNNIEEDDLETGPPMLDKFESTRTEERRNSSSKSPGYDAFVNPQNRNNDGLSEIDSSYKQSDIAELENYKEIPSILLENMVEDDQCVRDSLMRSIIEAEDDEVINADNTENNDNDRVITRATKWKEEQTNAAIDLLTRMKTINELLSSLKTEMIDPVKIKEIEDLIKDSADKLS